MNCGLHMMNITIWLTWSDLETQHPRFKQISTVPGKEGLVKVRLMQPFHDMYLAATYVANMHGRKKEAKTFAATRTAASVTCITYTDVKYE